MDRLVEKLLDLSYECFGILLPGLIFFVALLTTLFFCANIPGFGDFAELEGVYSTAAKYFWVSTFFLGMISYFLGQFLKWISKIALDPITTKSGKLGEKWKDEVPTLLKPLIYFFPKNPVLSYTDGESLKNAIGYLNIPDSGNEALNWIKFYGIGSRYIASTGEHSMCSTYQNKYTMHRSLTIGFSIISYLSLILILVNLAGIFFSFSSWLSVVFSIIFLLTSIMVTSLYFKSFCYFWTCLGNEVIWTINGLFLRKNLK